MVDYLYLFTYNSFAFLAKILPINIMNYLLKGLSSFAYKVDKKHHHIINANLKLAFDNKLTQKDRDDIAWGVKHRVDFFAISFVQNAGDIIKARELLDGYAGKLIAKIEKFDAIENIDEIIEVSDGLMVARGDLGIEMPYYEVPTLQKMLIKKANQASIPIITATQMLLSMTTNLTATRAEVSLSSI